jgi:two-component system sensor histidine kinase SenX3
MKFRRMSEKPTLGAELPSELTETLNQLDSDALVISTRDAVVFATAGIEQLGLVKEGRVQSQELMAIVRVVRRTHEKQLSTIELPRGPIGEGKHELRITVLPINDGEWIVIFIRDESEIERVAQVRRDFVANISHELKTPIGALSLLSEAVASAKNDPEAVSQFAERMQSEAKRLTELVQEIINLSRVQDSDPLREAQEFGIREVIDEAINQCRINAEARNIYVSASDIFDVTISGDREQIIMALHNLIENAINYSPENTKVSVTTNISDSIVGIRVTDQGIGIPESSLERIFERFYRVDPARSRQTGGTGLGLSIVKHIATKHGGEITVWSAENVGSTFELRMPISRKDNEALQ